MLRAAHKIVAADPNWRGRRAESAGRSWVFFNHDSVQGYARMQLLTDHFTSQYSDGRHEEALQDARHRELMAQGGTWHRFVEQHRAKRDGETARLAALEAEGRADLARVMSRLSGRVSVANANARVGSATQTDLAAKARALMVENDPDVIRAGLAEIAAALEGQAATVATRHGVMTP